MSTDGARNGQHSGAGSVRWVVVVLLLVILVALAIDNRDDTRVGFIGGDTSAPLFVVILIAAAAGAIIGWLVLHRPRSHHDSSPRRWTPKGPADAPDR